MICVWCHCEWFFSEGDFGLIMIGCITLLYKDELSEFFDRRSVFTPNS